MESGISEQSSNSLLASYVHLHTNALGKGKPISLLPAMDEISLLGASLVEGQLQIKNLGEGSKKPVHYLCQKSHGNPQITKKNLWRVMIIYILIRHGIKKKKNFKF